jgi:hypothetical protein
MQIGGNKESSGAFKVVCLGLPVIQSSDFDPAITRRRHDFPISVKCIYALPSNFGRFIYLIRVHKRVIYCSKALA